MDLSVAEKLAHDLRHAIEAAKQTPFQRWWNSLPGGTLEDTRRLAFGGGFLVVVRGEAEKLFNEIREAR